MIGDLPNPALASRCITIRMQPADKARQQELFEAQSVPLFNKKTGQPRRRTLAWRRRLEAELSAHGAELAKRQWEAPCQCEPRTTVMWQPLFAVADHFGGQWPERAREAFCELVDAAEIKEKKEIRFLRHVVRRLPHDIEVIMPEDLHKRVGPMFERKPLSKDQQGKWLSGVGAQSRVGRYPGLADGALRRAYVVADIRKAAEKWGVMGESA